MTSSTVLVVVTLATLVLFSLVRWITRQDNPTNLPYPPGLPGLPIVGNLYNMPRKEGSWVTLGALSEKYGAGVHLCPARLDIDAHFKNRRHHAF